MEFEFISSTVYLPLALSDSDEDFVVLFPIVYAIDVFILEPIVTEVKV